MVRVGVKHGQRPRRRAIGVLHAGLVQRQPFLVPHLQVLRHQVGLGRKVVVQAFLGHAGLANDGVDARGRNAIVVEQHGGGVQQALVRGLFRWGDGVHWIS